MKEYNTKELIKKMIIYKERKQKIKKVAEFNDFHDWYKELVNEFIPKEPDSRVLMELFICCNFDPVLFIKIVTGKEKPDVIKIFGMFT
jgi:hypothetical protein